MNPSTVVLQIYLKSGQGINLILPRQEAFTAIDQWNNQAINSFGGATLDGVNYALQTSEIAALLVLPYKEPQQNPVQQSIPRFPQIK